MGFVVSLYLVRRMLDVHVRKHIILVYWKKMRRRRKKRMKILQSHQRYCIVVYFYFVRIQYKSLS